MAMPASPHPGSYCRAAARSRGLATSSGRYKGPSCSRPGFWKLEAFLPLGGRGVAKLELVLPRVDAVETLPADWMN